MIPTPEEIVARIKAREDSMDLFGTEQSDLLYYLPFEHARPFLKATATKADWEKDGIKVLTREAALAEGEKYLDFAFGKMNGCRGLSSPRALHHYIAWTFLAGDREFSDQIAKMLDEDYCYYGKLILRRIAEHYGWDWKKFDDGDLINSEDGDPEYRNYEEPTPEQVRRTIESYG